MFDAKERIIGAAYVMPENLADIILNEIKLLRPTSENVSIDEIAISVLLEQEHLSENAKKERIIGAATVMSDDDARTIWKKIIEYTSIPEATEDELDQALEEGLKNASSKIEK